LGFSSPFCYHDQVNRQKHNPLWPAIGIKNRANDQSECRDGSRGIQAEPGTVGKKGLFVASSQMPQDGEERRTSRTMLPTAPRTNSAGQTIIAKRKKKGSSESVTRGLL
jgi:hypothetical protein